MKIASYIFSAFFLCVLCGAQSVSLPGEWARDLGQFTIAQEEIRSAMAKAGGNSLANANYRLGLAAVDVERGNYLEAQRALQRLNGESSAPDFNREVRLWLARALFEGGDYLGAAPVFAPLLKWAQEHQSELGAASVLYHAGRFAAARLEWAEAERLLNQAVRSADHAGDSKTALSARVNLALLHENRSREREAASEFDSIAGNPAAAGTAPQLWAIQDHAALAARRGEFSTARELLKRGLDLAKSEGMLAIESHFLLESGNVERRTAPVTQAIQSVEQAQAIALKAGELAGQANALDWRAWLEGLRGAAPAATNYYNTALQIQKQSGAVAAAARSEADFAYYDHSEASLTKAIAAEQRLVDTYRSLGQYRNLALAQVNLASRLTMQGRYAEALGLATQAVNYLDDHGDLYNAAQSRITLAEIQQVTKGAASGIASLSRSRTFFEETGDEINLAQILNRLGNIENSTSQFQMAQSHYQKALAIFQKLGSVADLPALFNNIGNLYYANDQYVDANQQYLKGKEAADRLGTPDLMVMSNLANSQRKRRAYDEANEEYGRELSLAITRGDSDYQAGALTGLGNVAGDRNQWDQALAKYQEVLKLWKDQGDDHEIASTMRRIGDIYRQRKNYPEALRWFEESEAYCRTSGDPLCVANGLEGRGKVYQSWGQSPKAADFLRKSLSILSTGEFPDAQSRLTNELGDCLKSQGEFREALDVYRNDLKWVQTHGVPISLYASRQLDIAQVLSDTTASTNDALKPTLEALHIYETLGAPEFIAAAYSAMAGIEANVGRTKPALQHYRLAAEFYQRASDKESTAVMYARIGDIESEAGDYIHALDATRKSLEIRQGLKLSDAQAESHWSLAETYRGMGRYLDAIRESSEGLRLAQDRDTTIGVLAELAYDQSDANMSGSALRTYARALELAVKAGDLVSQAKIYSWRAILYRDLNQFSEAEADLKKSLKSDQDTGDPGDIADVYNEFAITFRRAGALQDALEYNDKALDIVVQKNPDPDDAANFLESKATTLQLLNRPSDALQAVEQGLKFAGVANSKYNRVRLLVRRARIFNKFSDRGDADSVYRQALRLATAEGDRGHIALISDLLGDLEFSRNHLDAAKTWYEKSRSAARGDANVDEESQAEFDLGQAFEKSGEKTEALEHYVRAMDLNESVGMNSDVEDVSIARSGDAVPALRRSVDLMLEQEDFRRAFELIERVRGRSLLEEVSGRRLDYSRQVQGETPGMKATREKLASIERRIDDPGSGIDGLYKERADLMASYEAELRAFDTSRESSGRVARSLGEIQAALPSNTTVLVYFLAVRNSAVFLLDQGNFKCKLLGAPEALRAEIEKATTWDSQSPDRDLKGLKRLQDLLFSPVGSGIHSKLLGIVPDGAIYRVPFAALWDGKEYLSDRFVLFEIPSASFLSAMRRPDGRPGRILALSQSHPQGGIFLPAADREGREIASLFESSRYVGNAARKDLLEDSYAASIIHISAHSRITPQNPWNSAILLQQPVSVADIETLVHPHLELVVLSACETLGGRINNADEIVSLQRAFFVGGARTVIASLWGVDDGPTRDLMLSFYRHLSKGKSRGEALTLAESEVRRRYPHPAAWAAFVLTGDPGQVRLPVSRFHVTEILAGVLSLIVALACISLVLRTQRKR